MHNRPKPVFTWLIAVGGILAAVASGCSRGPQRVVVRGKVTYRGATVQRGSISFFPSDGTAGTSVIVPIADGQYSVDKMGGLFVGTYQISILGVRTPSNSKTSAAPTTGLRGGGRPPPDAEEQYLPAKFNHQTTLKKTIDGSQNPFTLDFALSD